VVVKQANKTETRKVKCKMRVQIVVKKAMCNYP